MAKTIAIPAAGDDAADLRGYGWNGRCERAVRPADEGRIARPLIVGMVLAAAEKMAEELCQRGERRLEDYPRGDVIEEQTVEDWRRKAGADAALFPMTAIERELVLAVGVLRAMA